MPQTFSALLLLQCTELQKSWAGQRFSRRSSTSLQTWRNLPETSATASTSLQSLNKRYDRQYVASEIQMSLTECVDGSGGGPVEVTDLSLLSMDMAQMFLQRLSSPLVACWMESHSVSVEQASQSCRRTSHRFSTDATPVLCFSMSLCRS